MRQSVKQLFIFLYLFLALGGAVARGQTSLSDQVREAVDNGVAFDTREIARIRETQYIFIDGIFGELLNKNFTPAMKLLKNKFTVQEVVALRPSTSLSITSNAQALYRQIRALRIASNAKSSVIIAHSKGGAATLLMALQHPELVNEFGVKAFIVVSAPLQGVTLGLKVPRREFLTATQSLSSPDREKLKARVFYVRTAMSDLDMASPLYVPHIFMKYFSLNGAPQNENDGLIATDNELFNFEGRAFGADLGIMRGDHNSLMDNTSRYRILRYRESFFEVLIKKTLSALELN